MANWKYSTMNFSGRQAGFTLIEVLVALAIVVISFLAMYGSAQQVVATTTLLQDKTFATWVAHDQITTLRIAGGFPDSERQNGEIELAGLEWRYSILIKETGSPAIRQIIVEVAPAAEPERVLAQVTGVLLDQSAAGPAQVSSGGDIVYSSGALLYTSAPDGTPVGAPPQHDQNQESGFQEHQGDEFER